VSSAKAIKVSLAPYVGVPDYTAVCSFENNGNCVVSSTVLSTEVIVNIRLEGVPKSGIWLQFTGREMVWTAQGWVRGARVVRILKDVKFTIVVNESERVDELQWFGVVSEQVDFDALGRSVSSSLSFGDEEDFDDCELPKLDSCSVVTATKAWLGDVQHKYDVRLYLALCGMFGGNRELEEDRFVGTGARVQWYREFLGPKETVSGITEASMLQGFQASYAGSFRAAYLTDKLTLPSNVMVDGHYFAFMSTLPISVSR